MREALLIGVLTGIAGCNKGPSAEELHTCDSAKATVVQKWTSVSDATKALTTETAAASWKRSQHEAMLAALASSDAGNKDRATAAAAVVEAEKAAREALVAAQTACEAVALAPRTAASLASASDAALAAVERAQAADSAAVSRHKDLSKAMSDDGESPSTVDVLAQVKLARQSAQDAKATMATVCAKVEKP